MKTERDMGTKTSKDMDIIATGYLQSELLPIT